MESTSKWMSDINPTSWAPLLNLSSIIKNSQRLIQLDEVVTIKQGFPIKNDLESASDVRIIRSQDSRQLILGLGLKLKENEQSGKSLIKNLAEPGDVFIPRATGDVSYKLKDGKSVIASEAFFIAKPDRMDFADKYLLGRLVSCALNTKPAQDLMNFFANSARSGSLTLSNLKQILIPNFNNEEFWHKCKEFRQRINDMESLIYNCDKSFDEINYEIADYFEFYLNPMIDFYSTTLNTYDFWDLNGWGWNHVQKLFLTKKARNSSKWIQLDSIIDFKNKPRVIWLHKRLSTGSENHYIKSRNIYPSCSLAMPQIETNKSILSKGYFFEITGECLLFPALGNITEKPSVIPKVVFSKAENVYASTQWVPVICTFPRVLSLIFDHPFVKQQRELSGFDIAKHLSLDDLKTVLIPKIPDGKMVSWEMELTNAQANYIKALTIRTELINEAESWYT